LIWSINEQEISKKCEKIITDVEINLSENRSNITFINKNKEDIRKVTVDGCAITQGIRCDWLLIRPDDKEFFVELKGSDLKHAYEQIERSIKQIAKDCYIREKNIYIVMSKYPSKPPALQFMQRYFQDTYKATLMVIETDTIQEIQSV
jgi:DNA-binding protein YbaB